MPAEVHSSMASSSEDRSPQPLRLPVNPRRHKVAPEQRKRVMRACNACNVRRVRCTGEQPCQRCRKVSRVCQYPAPESDKSALKTELEQLQQKYTELEKAFHAIAPHVAGDMIRQVAEQSNATALSAFPTFQSAPSEVDEAEAEAAEGRLLQDDDGNQRFLGETSGATFLDCLKQFMRTVVSQNKDWPTFLQSIGRYQTFDSRPLPNPEVNPSWLPPPAEMAQMLTEVRSHIQDTNVDGFASASGGIYWWGDMITLPVQMANSATLSAMTTNDTSRHLAFYHVCFALASSINSASFRTGINSGEAYFERARRLLGNPLESVKFTLTDVPVLTLMGFYLIELNRRDAAYMYVSLAVHIAIIHGAFRSDPDEASKRTLWTLYLLERWLSVLMGRPPTISDDAVRLRLPIDVANMPPAAGLRAHIELSYISGYIVCETFKIAPRIYRSGFSVSNIDKALDKLKLWLAQLPPVLQIASEPSDLEPATCMLHMAHNQLIVLTTRAIFLAVVKQAVAACIMRGNWSFEQHVHGKYLKICTAAAHRNMNLAQRIRPRKKLLQAGLHFVFNAAVILLLDRLIQGIPACPLGLGHALPPTHGDGLHATEIWFAIHVFEQEAKTGTAYPRDCCNVLQDLKALVDHYQSSNQQAIEQWYTNAPDCKDLGAESRITPSLGTQASPMALAENNDFYEQMKLWERDGLQLRNGLLI